LNGSKLTNLLSSAHYVDSGCGLNFNFTDSGLFGVRLTGDAANGRKLLDDAVG